MRSLPLASMRSGPHRRWVSAKIRLACVATLVCALLITSSGNALSTDRVLASDPVADEFLRKCSARRSTPCTPSDALIDALRAPGPQVALSLIARGADPNLRDKDGVPAIVLAAELGGLAVVHALLRAGAEVDARTADGETALHRAIIYDRRAVVQRLLAGGADPNARIRGGPRREGWTPLMIAAATGRAALVNLLITAGAAVDSRNVRGRTALLFASWYGHEEVVERLLAAGARPELADLVGLTPARAAALAGHRRVASMLAARARR